MALTVKTCCGCFELRKGSIVIGSLLLVLAGIKLFISSKELYNFIRLLLNYYHGPYDKDITIILITTLISEVAQILLFIFLSFLLIGLIKNKQSYAKALVETTAICYCIDLIVFIFLSLYYSLYLYNILNILFFSADIAIKLLTPYFLILVRSHCQSKNTNELPVVDHSIKKQSTALVSDVPSDNADGNNVEEPAAYFPSVHSEEEASPPKRLYPRIYPSKEEIIMPNTLYPNIFTSGLNGKQLRNPNTIQI